VQRRFFDKSSKGAKPLSEVLFFGAILKERCPELFWQCVLKFDAKRFLDKNSKSAFLS
jgi:hypothetical protein